MGRWKPPPPASSPYITPGGYEDLQSELKQLWLRRKEVVAALSAAAAEGDRSENAEYIYRKKELGGLDYRIRYLQKRLPKLNVVKGAPDAKQIFFGAWVMLTHEDGSETEYRIVGPDEADAAQGKISLDSPLAKALLKKQLGDEIKLQLPERHELLVVAGIRYSTGNPGI
ncbi:MAG: transcription elongation factor GreB [Gammaproteobacteria bacterium]|nr:transcription elongation factor GreB [Gammaproteobacteria bacterium]